MTSGMTVGSRANCRDSVEGKDLIAFGSLDSVSCAAQLGTDEFANMTPVTLERGNQVALAGLRCVAISVKIDQITNVN